MAVKAAMVIEAQTDRATATIVGAITLALAAVYGALLAVGWAVAVVSAGGGAAKEGLANSAVNLAAPSVGFVLVLAAGWWLRSRGRHWLALALLAAPLAALGVWLL